MELVQKAYAARTLTPNFLPGFVTSNSDICWTGHLAFKPPGNFPLAPKLSTAIIFSPQNHPRLDILVGDR
jgi:hypothetical protein